MITVPVTAGFIQAGSLKALGPRDFTLLVAIRLSRGKESRGRYLALTSTSKLADETGVSEELVEIGLNRLVELGFLEIHNPEGAQVMVVSQAPFSTAGVRRVHSALDRAVASAAARTAEAGQRKADKAEARKQAREARKADSTKCWEAYEREWKIHFAELACTPWRTKERKLAKDLVTDYGLETAIKMCAAWVAQWNSFAPVAKFSGVPTMPLLFGCRAWVAAAVSQGSPLIDFCGRSERRPPPRRPQNDEHRSAESSARMPAWMRKG